MLIGLFANDITVNCGHLKATCPLDCVISQTSNLQSNPTNDTFRMHPYVGRPIHNECERPAVAVVLLCRGQRCVELIQSKVNSMKPLQCGKGTHLFKLPQCVYMMACVTVCGCWRAGPLGAACCYDERPPLHTSFISCK